MCRRPTRSRRRHTAPFPYATQPEAREIVFDFLDGYDVLGAFWMTVKLTALSAVGSLIWGTLLAAMRVSPVPLLRGVGTAYVNIVRNIPLTVIILFCSAGLADVFGVTLGTEDFKLQGFRLAVLGLVAYTAAFVCEALRSGMNTVPLGQAEAARALGLSFTQTLTLIVLPQAFRSVIGPLANVLIALTKNTTVAAAIGVAEAAYLMKTMIENEAQTLLIGAVFAFGFVVLTLPTGLILGWLSKRLAVKR
ncbi:glutamate transport system permease protein [Streptomyces sp. B4I13]|nr:glutamate transport system permease protein [Streptomyces sp. B4I13]